MFTVAFRRRTAAGRFGICKLRFRACFMKLSSFEIVYYWKPLENWFNFRNLTFITELHFMSASRQLFFLKIWLEGLLPTSCLTPIQIAFGWNNWRKYNGYLSPSSAEDALHNCQILERQEGSALFSSANHHLIPSIQKQCSILEMSKEEGPRMLLLIKDDILKTYVVFDFVVLLPQGFHQISCE